MDFWTDERVEQLKALLAEGYTASGIAQRLGDGCTRSMVCGKTHRSNGAMHLSSGAKSATSRSRNDGNFTPGPRRARTMTAKPPPPLEPVALTDESGAPITIATVREGQCKFGHGDPQTEDFHLCAHPVIGEGRSWCAFHFSRVCDLEGSRRVRSFFTDSNRRAA